ncbi:AAA family ATPase [Tessaracoccus rhinocerotis]|uniref:AAA family ATPase n=1 Tax=Tessaracoccus rhinocerotis TaxID=1689449 RepID=A0A553K3Z0_9ACTN|nr:MobF family relaxase [Tessaracoccus rhinocerotis]TRY19429.1 AAA family ATPase [Tessaracoccus rhinocerotis]
MVASVHKLTAGSGYDYLTRQVAALDSTEKGHTTLASYYTEKGEVPGTWLGSGMSGLGDLVVGDRVNAEQMRALFGGGFHPNMAARLAALPGDATEVQIRDASRLGNPFRVQPSVTEFQKEVAVRCSQWQSSHDGLEVPVGVKAEIRSQIASERFHRRLGRIPSGLELSTEVARLSRDPSTACAGYDVTFTPVKSVSALWAVAPLGLAARIEEAHNAAVSDALRFLEEHALFTRAGAGGVRQLDVRGLVAAGFVHRDSRAGDPNLHTHVAIANKVQTLDGRWLAIDGRLIFKAMVSVSETYNTQLEAHLASLGIRFTERPGDDRSKRPVREIVGVAPGLMRRWSSRRAAIEARQEVLAAQFQNSHGRPPSPGEALKLAQQATLETRDAKHESRSVTEQRNTWHAEAAAVLGERGITEMVHAVTSNQSRPLRLPAGWVSATAVEVVAAVESSRATWQVWHLRAEASRRAREHASNPEQVEGLTQDLLREATELCLPLEEHGGDGIAEPAQLRRRDGASVYTVSGAARFTSRSVVAAETRILELAGRSDGRRIGEQFVSLALLESVANGVTLNAGQSNLVRQMATSGSRVQLAMAAAGSGKTTALRVLAAAWRDSGGNVIGLAPSAVAAGILREQVDGATTVAKLVWDLDHHTQNDLLAKIGAETMVVIDEAGMTDTHSLARVIEHVVAKGGSVRLVGDDQQLAAISAGGVLRDLAHTHGAVELSELMRFEDKAEAAASLALRDGRPEALGFYLDADRIHVGTGETSLETAFGHWIQDQSAGMDSLMLAGTKEAVFELNRRAREHRLAAQAPNTVGPSVVLSDGNQASIGDVIVTRMNDRRLAFSETDWVKNGDRWTVHNITADGGLVVRHRNTGLTAHLPARYVADHTQLGYAVTIHTAQGLTVDVTRGVLSGSESRQQLYVMATRGKHANHIYLPVVGDGGEHSVLHPTTLRPLTASDILETILACDGAARSATTETREAADPHQRLAHAAARYQDALHAAAEQLAPAEKVEMLDQQADQLHAGLTSCPAWPTLRAMLILTAADGGDPLAELRAAVAARELESAHDPAAVLTWRIHTPPIQGPLPWLPGIPKTLAQHPNWGPYLTRRAALVDHCTQELRTTPQAVRPAWALPGQRLTPSLIADVETWRAATGVEVTDRRATGPTPLGSAAKEWKRALDQRLNPGIVGIWTDLLGDIHPGIHNDPYAPALTHRIAALHNSGVPVSALLAEATAEGPLPADQPAAALWWRLSRHLQPNQTTVPTAAEPSLAWAPALQALVGQSKLAELEGSPWWPLLVETINKGIDTGHRLENLVAPSIDTSAFDDDCQALMWRAQQQINPQPEPSDDPSHPDEMPPDDLHLIDWNTTPTLDDALKHAAELRELTDPDNTQLELEQAFERADRWAASPHTPERLARINELTTEFYATQLSTSWAERHLIQRLGQDLAGDPRFRPGYAPDGWTNLTNHLRSEGINDDEMLAAGVATRTKHGRIIDQFRDRLVLPVITDGVVRGFVGRRNPDRHDDHAGPKYLNTTTTPMFSKKDILYSQDLLDKGAVPVIAEGPIDAIAITLAGQGHYIGVAPLGTSLTHYQALLLANHQHPVIATDADNAGELAAENAYWILATQRLDPTRAAFPEGTDPAQLLQTDGPANLYQALQDGEPQADHMVRERRSSLARREGMIQQVEILAARPGHRWAELGKLLARNDGGADFFKQLLDSATEWTSRPSAAGDRAHEQTQQLRQRLQQPPTSPKSSGVPDRERRAARMRATRANRSRTPSR